MTEFPEVMTHAQAAEFLQVHPTTLKRYVRAGFIRARRIGHSVRYLKSELLEDIAQNPGEAAEAKGPSMNTRRRG